MKNDYKVINVLMFSCRIVMVLLICEKLDTSDAGIVMFTIYSH